MKKTISIGLCILFVVQMAVVSFASDSADRSYITVNTGNGNEIECAAMVSDGEIYVAAEDVASVAGYVCDIGEQIGFAKEPGSSFYQFDVDFDGNVHMRGHEYQIQVERVGGQYFLPLEKMLYLMHAAWCVEDGVLYVNPLPYALPDFFADFYGDFRRNLTTDEDILMNGENDLLRSVRSSLASMIRDFDVRYYIPVWGANEMLEEDYENILLNLTETKESYIGNLPEAMVESELEGTLLSEMSEENRRLKFVIDLPLRVDDLDTAIETYGKSSGIARKIAGNVDLKEVFDRDQLQKISDQVGEMGDAISYFTSICNVVDVLKTADSMNDSFIQQMEILKDFDASRYEGSAVSRIKNAASNLIQTKENKLAAVSEKAFEETLNIAGENAVGMTPAGKLVAAVQTADMALSVLSDDYADSMEAATISYMLGQSVNLEFIALREMERYVQEMNGLEYQYTAENAEKIRSAALLYLNLNLRDKCYIYYLNSINNDVPNWVESDQAKEMKKDIAGVQAMRAALISTEEYDRHIGLDEFEKMYSDEQGMVRERISEGILHQERGEGDNSKKEETDAASDSDITQDQAVELARQKMGDNFGYVYSKMLEFQGVNYYVILVKGSVDEPGAPAVTLTKIFVSTDGSEVREGAEIVENGVDGIEFFE